MDMYKLEYEIKRRGKTVEEFCKGIGISKSAYYRKRSGTTEFTHGEIQRTIEVLGLDSPMDIFFTVKVS